MAEQIAMLMCPKPDQKQSPYLKLFSPYETHKDFSPKLLMVDQRDKERKSNIPILWNYEHLETKTFLVRAPTLGTSKRCTPIFRQL
jgi:hypothetical protein